MHDIQKYWIVVSTLLGLISSVYCDLHHLISNQWPQIAKPKLYTLATSPVSALQSVVAGQDPEVEIMVYTADET